MAQKTHPVNFRSNFFKDLNILEQAHGHLYTAFIVQEQQQVIFFSTFFFHFFGVRLHSLKYGKITAKKSHLVLKYTSQKKKRAGSLFLLPPKIFSFYFRNLEEGLLFGLSQITSKLYLKVFFLNLSKKRSFFHFDAEKITNSFFLKEELFFFVKALLFFKGGAFLLTRIISAKLQKMRSRKEKKKQTKLLQFVKLFFTYVLKHNFVFLRGIKFSIKGRLNGSLRKKKWVFLKGKTAIHKTATKIDFSFLVAQTPFGSFGLKVWLNYGNS
jgi:hypothetical protein